MSNDPVVNAVADKFARLVAGGDLDGLCAPYTLDARIWHNTDDKAKTIEENMELLDGLLGVTAWRRLSDTSRIV